MSAAGKATAVHRELVALFDGALHPVVVLRNGRVVHANPAFQDLLGQERTLRGKPLADLCHPEDRAALDGLGKGDPPPEVLLRLAGPPPMDVAATAATLVLGGRNLLVLRLRCLPPNRQHVREAPSDTLLADRTLWDVLERASTGFWLGDVEGRTMLCNQHSANLLGMRVADLYAVTLFDLLKLEGGATLEGVHHVTYARSDGAEVQLEVALAIIQAEDGTAAGAFALMRDMTAQSQMLRELRRSERRYRALVETAPCAVCVMGANGGPFLEVNAMCTRMFGYRRDEWLSGAVSPVQLYANPEDRPRLLARIKEEGRLMDAPVAMRRNTGEVFPARMSVTRFFSDGDERLAVALLDCSAEAAPASTNASGLAHVLQALEQAVQDPLVSLHTLLQGPPSDDTLARSRKRLKEVSRGVHRLLADLQFLAQVDATPAGQEPVDLAALWAAVVEEEAPWLRGRSVPATRADPPPKVRGSSRLLKVMLRSLVQHGVRAGQGAAVRLGAGDCTEAHAAFWVEDDAPPPPHDVRERAFDILGWPDAGPVGLALARTVVERHGGRVWLECPPQGGSRVCFTLPRR